MSLHPQILLLVLSHKKLLVINPCSPPPQFRHAPSGNCAVPPHEISHHCIYEQSPKAKREVPVVEGADRHGKDTQRYESIYCSQWFHSRSKEECRFSLVLGQATLVFTSEKKLFHACGELKTNLIPHGDKLMIQTTTNKMPSFIVRRNL